MNAQAEPPLSLPNSPTTLTVAWIEWRTKQLTPPDKPLRRNSGAWRAAVREGAAKVGAGLPGFDGVKEANATQFEAPGYPNDRYYTVSLANPMVFATR